MPPGPRLGIDFGTSHTVSLITWPDGRVRPLLFDGSPLLPSAVCAEAPTAGGIAQLLVGRDAVHAARIDPARFEGTPKRRIDDGTVLLGSEEYAVSTLIAAVLARVREEAIRVLGGQPSEVMMSHPASWGVSRRLTLLEAAGQAGLGEPLLVPEPVAAARYFAGLIGDRFAPDHGVLVYDFGGGTFDASLVIRGPIGFDVRAVDGIDDLGGLDLDELIVEYARESLSGEHAAAWQRLANPETPEDRRHRRTLWDDARIVKERLSRTETALFHVPLLGVDVTLTRAAFEDLARASIERTARTTAAVLRWSQLPSQRLVGVFLVGGSSRIPLVSTVLERELGIAPTVLEQPELVVAEGALRRGDPAAPSYLGTATTTGAAAGTATTTGAATGPAESADSAVAQGSAVATDTSRSPSRQPTVYQTSSAPPRGRRRTLWAPFLVALFAVAVVALGYALVPMFDRPGSDPGGPGPRHSVPATQPPYLRKDRPDWLPADWTLAVEGPADKLWQTSDEVPEGGRCEVSGDLLRVTRKDAVDLTGCTIQSPLDRIFYDVAVEANVTVARGCVGIWARTGSKGYFLAICDGYARLSRLGQGGADTILLKTWQFGYRPRDATVALLVVGDQLTVYLSGVRLGDPVEHGEVRYGRVTAGGQPGSADSIDVTLSAVRIFAPRGQSASSAVTPQANPQQHTTAKPPAVKSSSPGTPTGTGSSAVSASP